MLGHLVLFSFIVFFCKVQSQLCSPPILPPACPALCPPTPCQPIAPPCSLPCPQVIYPDPCVTTIVDNSVSNALVNALQLLIVSNLIGATIGSSTPLNANLGPLLESIVCPNLCSVEVAIPEYITCAPNYEFVSPCSPFPSCGPYYEPIPPCRSPIVPCSPVYDVISPCVSVTTCGPNYEIIPPYASIIDPYLPPLYNLADVSPNYIAYSETTAPICIETLTYNGYGETLVPVYGVETIGPNFCGGYTEVVPNYIYPCPEICPTINPYYGGLAETVTPAVAALPNVFGCLNEVVAPTLPPLANICAPEILSFGASLTPNYFGGLTEVPVSLGAEVIFPPAIPPPLACNYGYPPPPLPCMKANLEPIAYDNCMCNGYGGPIYY